MKQFIYSFFFALGFYLAGIIDLIKSIKKKFELTKEHSEAVKQTIDEDLYDIHGIYR